MSALDYWHPVLGSRELSRDRVAGVRVAGHSIAVFRTADGRLGYFETVDLDVVWHGRETTVRAQVLDEAMLGTRMLKGCELVAVWNAGGIVSIRS